jgi:hypothetical protein
MTSTRCALLAVPKKASFAVLLNSRCCLLCAVMGNARASSSCFVLWQQHKFCCDLAAVTLPACTSEGPCRLCAMRVCPLDVMFVLSTDTGSAARSVTCCFDCLAVSTLTADRHFWWRAQAPAVAPARLLLQQSLTHSVRLACSVTDR